MKPLTTAAMVLAWLLALTACSSTPTRPEGLGKVFPRSAAAVQKATAHAFVVTGFEVQGAESLYVQAVKTRAMGLFTARIYLPKLGLITPAHLQAELVSRHQCEP